MVGSIHTNRLLACIVSVLIGQILLGQTPCYLGIRNTSFSPVWLIEQSPVYPVKTGSDLEALGATIVEPHEKTVVCAEKPYTIYTRLAHSNNEVQKHFTVVYRTHNELEATQELLLSALEEGTIDPARFLVIDHTKEQEVPEANYPLCPGGLHAELDYETHQWMCRVERHSPVYNQHVVEYVPVLSYIYQWLPRSVWVAWYIKNPHFYAWYHHNPDLYQHLPRYQAPWTTSEYTAWYTAQPTHIQESYRKPEHPTTHSFAAYVPTAKEPIGIAQQRVKLTRSSSHSKTFDTHNTVIKKQTLEDIVSSVTINNAVAAAPNCRLPRTFKTRSKKHRTATAPSARGTKNQTINL
jgi:hypothetical protein